RGGGRGDDERGDNADSATTADGVRRPDRRCRLGRDHRSVCDRHRGDRQAAEDRRRRVSAVGDGQRRMGTRDPLSIDAIRELAEALIRCPSVNPDIAPDEAHGEDAVATLACAWLSEHGVEAWKEADGSGRPNAVARVDGGPGPTLVLCAHRDTVGTQGMEAPFTPVVRDGKLFGRGSYDMKGSAAAIMCAAATLARRPFAGHVLLALVADEEYASVGAQHFVARH